MVGSLNLLTPVTLFLICAAPIILGLAPISWRQWAFLCLNLSFLTLCVLGPAGTITTLGFAAVGYGSLRLAVVTPRWVPAAAIAVLVGLFAYMRRYTFLDAILPETLLTSVLSTVGLSFLLFKILHIVVDARSGTLGPIDPLSYVNYCTNFTAFAMGPIQRFQDYRRQWETSSAERSTTMQLDAVIRILTGLVKAYVLAEFLHPYAELLTRSPADRGFVETLLALYAFNLYLYLNFSGYCDVVIGAGSLFGVVPPENFDKPFLARNVADFWQRQHRTLTQWLTDYVFTPTFKGLLVWRRGRIPVLIAADLSLMLTMIVSGLWHGTTVAFLLFGLIHGAYLVIYRTWDALLTKSMGARGVRLWRSRWWVRAVGIAITFNAVSFSFVFLLLDAPTALRVIGATLWP